MPSEKRLEKFKWALNHYSAIGTDELMEDNDRDCNEDAWALDFLYYVSRLEKLFLRISSDCTESEKKEIFDYCGNLLAHVATTLPRPTYLSWEIDRLKRFVEAADKRADRAEKRLKELEDSLEKPQDS